MIDRQFLLLPFEPWPVVMAHPLDLSFTSGPNLRLQVRVRDAIEGGTGHQTFVFMIVGRRLWDGKLGEG